MTERVLTPEALVEMIEASPDNPLSDGVALLRSGRRLIVRSFIDVEKLTSRINEWFAGSEGAGQ